MRILLISEYFPDSEISDITGGIEARCHNIAKKLSKNNDVTVITSWKNGQRRNDLFGKVKVIRVGNEHSYSNEGGFVSRINFAVASIKKGLSLKNIDIIDGQNFTSYYPAYYIAKRLNIPCVITYHETWIGEWIKNKGLLTGFPYGIYEKLLLKLKYSKIIAVSNFTKKRLQKFYQGDISVAYNGINPEEFSFSCRKIKNQICFIGRLVETKRADILLRAVAEIKKEISEIRCIIVGQGKEKLNLEQLSNSLNLDANVTFAGFVKDSSKIKKILKSSAVFCLPSIAEGFGIALIESVAAGTPYVCSDLEVLKEVTENSKGGFIFERDNVSDLARKLLILLKNKDIYCKKQREAKIISAKYTWKKSADEVENIYKQVIKDYNSGKK